MEGGDGGRERGRQAGIASRLGHAAEGWAVVNVGASGRLLAASEQPAPVWVVGRAGGAAGYLESLESGVRAAVDVVERLVGRTGGNGSLVCSGITG